MKSLQTATEKKRATTADVLGNVAGRKAPSPDCPTGRSKAKCKRCDGRGYTEALNGVYTCTECLGSGDSPSLPSPLRGKSSGGAQ